MLRNFGWRLPAGSTRAMIAAAGLAVIALIIATYGNAKEISQDSKKPSGASTDQEAPPLISPGEPARTQ